MEENIEDEFYESPCGYFDGQTTKENFEWILSEDLLTDISKNPPDGYTYQEVYYGELLEKGWRRSGPFFYRETCPHCKKCLPIRVCVDDFVPSKSQRKALKKNSDLEITLTSNPTDFVTDEKIKLFQMYDKRHNPDSEKSYEESLETIFGLNGLEDVDRKTYSGTYNMDYRLNGKLIGVGVLDKAVDSLSSNYFYYDTSDEILKRSLGVFSMIMEIEACRGNLFDGQLKSDYHYLGYYIADCDKMNYKNQYKPYQLLIDGNWTEFVH